MKLVNSQVIISSQFNDKRVEKDKITLKYQQIFTKRIGIPVTKRETGTLL